MSIKNLKQKFEDYIKSVKKFYWSQISDEVKPDNAKGGQVPDSTLWQFLWTYFELSKDSKRIAKAIKLAQKISDDDPYHKRVYVFKDPHGGYKIADSMAAKALYNAGFFKKGLRYDEVLTYAKWHTPYKEYNPNEQFGLNPKRKK